jgi:acetyl esterase/lipase
LVVALKRAARSVTDHRSPIQTRLALENLSRLAPPVWGVSQRAGSLGGVPARWFTPRGTHPDGPILMHIHGGGFSLCSSHVHAMLISELARAVGARAVGIDYRLSPEFPFPLPIEDCYSAYIGLLDSGVDASRIILCGDSAGGNLALATLQRVRAANKPLPRLVVLLSPWVDLECRGDSVQFNDPYDYLSRDLLELFAAYYLQGADPRDPQASPIHADLSGLPPMLVHAGGGETLLSEIRTLVRRAERHGVRVTLQEWEGMCHAFHGFSMFIPEAERAFHEIATWIRAQHAFPRAGLLRRSVPGLGRLLASA